MTEKEVIDVVQNTERLKFLRQLGLLDSPSEPAFDRLTRLASKLLGVPVALVSIVDANRQFFKSQVGLEEPWATKRETPLTHSFCKHVVASNSTMIVSDARKDPLVCNNLAVADLGVGAYLGIPLTTSHGFVLGAMCCIDGCPHNWSDDHIDILNDLAASVVTEIELRAEVIARRDAVKNALEAQAIAEIANRSKSQFLTNMSHELRTPLNSVIGFSNIILKNKEDALSEQDIIYLTRIRENGNHLLNLINSILDLSKIESGQVELNMESVSLQSLIDDVVSICGTQLSEGNVRIELKFPDDMLPIKTDKFRLKQVLINLVGNAIKFTTKGTITITVNVNAKTRHPFSIDVIDTGIGIAEEELEKVFDAFHQVDSSKSRNYEGTGLGLNISHSLCYFMGYSLTVKSDEGKGTTFSINLCLRPKTRREMAPHEQ